MRAFIAVSLSMSIAVPASADFNLLSGPESISLLAVGAVALL